MSAKHTATNNELDDIRASVRQLCDTFGEEYWLQMDRDPRFRSRD